MGHMIQPGLLLHPLGTRPETALGLGAVGRKGIKAQSIAPRFMSEAKTRSSPLPSLWACFGAARTEGRGLPSITKSGCKWLPEWRRARPTRATAVHTNAQAGRRRAWNGPTDFGRAHGEIAAVEWRLPECQAGEVSR